MKEAVLLGSYTNTIEKELCLIDTILEWKKYDIPIILSTHYPVSERIQNLVDYYIFDKNQHMEDSLTVRQIYYFDNMEINAKANKPYHAAAGLIAFQNAIKMMGNKFDFIYLQDYDVELNIPKVLEFTRQNYSSPYEIFYFKWKDDSENTFATNVCFFKKGMFNKIWGDIQSVDDYWKLVNSTNKNNFFIEHLAKNLIEIKNLHDKVYIFNKEQTNELVLNFSKHTADINDPRIYISSIEDGAVLFLVNHHPQARTFKIQVQNLITNETYENNQILNGGLFLFSTKINNNTYLKVSCENIVKEYYINSFHKYEDCYFKFH